MALYSMAQISATYKKLEKAVRYMKVRIEVDKMMAMSEACGPSKYGNILKASQTMI